VPRYQILYWHDIPVQVRVRHKRERISKNLSDRFQEAVDNAAMHAGLTGDDAYMDGFRWSELQERAGTPQEVVAAVAAELEAQYPEIDWQRTAANLKSKPVPD
jgi:hypothetical protein